MDPPRIDYLAVARLVSPGVAAGVLAERVHHADPRYDYKDHLTKVLHSPGWAHVNSDRLSLNDDDRKFYILIGEEENLAYVVVTSSTYPGRHIYGTPARRGILTDIREGFLAEFETTFRTASPGELTKPSSSILKGLAKKYSDLRSIDKILDVKAKVDEVSSIMRDNLDLAFARGERFENAQQKTEDLQDTVQLFAKETKEVQRTSRWKSFKIGCICLMLLSTILAVAVYTVLSSNGLKFGDDAILFEGNSTTNGTFAFEDGVVAGGDDGTPTE